MTTWSTPARPRPHDEGTDHRPAPEPTDRRTATSPAPKLIAGLAGALLLSALLAAASPRSLADQRHRSTPALSGSAGVALPVWIDGREIQLAVAEDEGGACVRLTAGARGSGFCRPAWDLSTSSVPPGLTFLTDGRGRTASGAVTAGLLLTLADPNRSVTYVDPATGRRSTADRDRTVRLAIDGHQVTAYVHVLGPHQVGVDDDAPLYAAYR